MWFNRGQVSIGLLISLASTSTGALLGALAAQQAPGGVPTMLGTAAVLVGIYGFLLLSYRDLLKAIAKLEGEPRARADAIALLREDMNRGLGGLADKVEGLEQRELERLERRARPRDQDRPE